MIVSGVLITAGVYLMMERSLTRILVGVLLAGNGVNLLFLIASGEPGWGAVHRHRAGPDISDPLPQAMVLTAIVITLGLTAFLLTMAYRSFQLNGHDEVADDVEDRQIVQLAEADLASASFDEDAAVGGHRRSDRTPAEEGERAQEQRGRRRASGRGRGGHRRDHRTSLEGPAREQPAAAARPAPAARRRARPDPRSSSAGPAGRVQHCCCRVVVAATLVVLTDRHGPIVLWVGAWPEPLGVALVADRLSSLMLLVSSIVTFTVLVFSMGQDVEERKRETPSRSTTRRSWCWRPASPTRSWPVTCSTCSSASRSCCSPRTCC